MKREAYQAAPQLVSARAVKWALAHPEVRGGEKVVLAALAWLADDNGVTFHGQQRIAETCALSVRSVRAHIARLAADDVIYLAERRRPNGSRTTDVIVLQMADAPDFDLAMYSGLLRYEDPDVDPVSGRADALPEPCPPVDPVAEALPLGGTTGAPGSGPDQHVDQSLQKKRRTTEWVTRARATVDGSPVTPGEWDVVEAAVKAINDTFGTRFKTTTVATYRPIVMRIRDHSELTAEDHVAIVRSFSDNRYWERDGRSLSIGNVYGPNAFETAAQALHAQTAARKSGRAGHGPNEVRGANGIWYSNDFQRQIAGVERWEDVHK